MTTQGQVLHIFKGLIPILELTVETDVSAVLAIANDIMNDRERVE